MHVNMYIHTCIHSNIDAPTCEVGVNMQVYTHTFVNLYVHTFSFQTYMYTCVYIHTHTNTDTYACIPMRTQCICIHPWCLSCIHIYMYIPTHTYKKKTCKQDTNTDMYACIGMHALYMHTRCLFIHICIDVHTYTNTCKLSLTTCKHIYHLQTRCA